MSIDLMEKNASHLTGQPTQPCPACDGTMPADAVVIEPYREVKPGYFERLVYMLCPHCDHFESRTEGIYPNLG